MVLDTAKEGMPAKELALKHKALAEKLGYGDWVLYGPCHGNGTMEGEAPWVETSADFNLKENMTAQEFLSIENIRQNFINNTKGSEQYE
jgi:hypothetical protein